MATSADLASAAAAAGSVPASYNTLADGAFARMFFSGDVGNQISSCQCVAPLPGGWIAFPPGGSTCADPPPEIIPTSECAPITAMERSWPASRGRMWSFLSSTMPPSAIFCVMARLRSTSGTPLTGGSSTTPVANMERRMRCTWSLSSATGTFPDSTAFFISIP